MAKFGQCEFGSFEYGSGTICEYVDAYIITNISRRPVNIYISQATYTPIAPHLNGWVSIKPGSSISVESTRVNEGWLASLQHLGAIRYSERDI